MMHKGKPGFYPGFFVYLCGMNRYLIVLLSLFGLSLLLFSCGGKRKKLVDEAPLISQTYTDQTGREITLPNRPKRVISLAPNITEIVFAIGAQDKLVARSQACDFPAEALSYPQVTTYPSLDLEELKSYNPDLLLTTDEIFTPDDIKRLQQLGLPVYVQQYKDIDDIFEGIRDMGRLLRVEEQANRVADSLQAIQKRVLDSTENQVHYRTMILVSNDPLKVIGGGSYLNEIIAQAGGENIFDANEQGYPNTTVEQILSLKPEVLIIPARRQNVYAELLSVYPALYNTPADENKQVHVVDPDLFYRPGPRLVEGLLDLTNILHSKLSPSVFVETPEEEAF